jgi:hypothetical protein
MVFYISNSRKIQAWFRHCHLQILRWRKVNFYFKKLLKVKTLESIDAGLGASARCTIVNTIGSCPHSHCSFGVRTPRISAPSDFLKLVIYEI